MNASILEPMKRAGIKPTKTGAVVSFVGCLIAIAMSVAAMALLQVPLIVWLVVLGQLLLAFAVCVYILLGDAPALSAVEYEDDEPVSPTARLHQLQKLWDDDLISDAEFRAKRAEIIKDL